MTSTAAATDKPADSTNGESKTDEPPSKRRRVALACNACRTRKSRCNGERPKCSLCRNLGFDCQYEPTDSSTNVIVKKEYVSDFETRLKSVEEILKRHDDMLIGHLSACSGRALPSSTTPRENVPNALASRESIQIDASELQDLPAEETLTDGMAMSFVNEFDSAFFGPSSNIAFTRHILRAMASRNITQPRTLTVHGNRPLIESGILDYSRPTSPSSPYTSPKSLGAVFELPPVVELEQLIRSYFSNTGLLFPFVHEPSFMETYYKFKASNFTKVKRSWLGLLNVVMAMGSSLDPGSKKSGRARLEKSNIFYQRAMHLSEKSSARGASLDIVQYLLLASQYLQSTQKSSQTWTLHGLAVKGAFALGLHSYQASQRFGPLENEIRKRTWYGCVLLDRVLSMTFGRPPCIPEEYIRLPLAQPWPNEKQNYLENSELEMPSMDFYNASITLHRLIGTSIARLYGQNLGCDETLQESEMIPRVFEMEQELNRWQTTLSHELSLMPSTSLPVPTSYRNRKIARFRTMLTLRYHNLNMLVHRPLLCKSLDSLAESPPSGSWPSSINRMTKGSIDACLGSAEETINIVHGILTDPQLGESILGAWWFTLFYLFNSSLVVFANSLIRRPTAQHPGQQIPQDIEHISRALDAFRLLDSENRIVDRCTEYVQYLLRVLERWSQSGIEPQQDNKSRHGFGPQSYQAGEGARNGGMGVSSGMELNDELPDLSDFLKDDLELAQFFASGIFDMQNSTDVGM